MIAQAWIAVFGVAAVWLSQDERESVRRWACVCGLCGQPFWITTALLNHQWGILALTVLYTWSWWRGVRTYWWRRAA